MKSSHSLVPMNAVLRFRTRITPHFAMLCNIRSIYINRKTFCCVKTTLIIILRDAYRSCISFKESEMSYNSLLENMGKIKNSIIVLSYIFTISLQFYSKLVKILSHFKCKQYSSPVGSKTDSESR